MPLGDFIQRPLRSANVPIWQYLLGSSRYLTTWDRETSRPSLIRIISVQEATRSDCFFITVPYNITFAFCLLTINSLNHLLPLVSAREQQSGSTNPAHLPSPEALPFTCPSHVSLRSLATIPPTHNPSPSSTLQSSKHRPHNRSDFPHPSQKANSIQTTSPLFRRHSLCSFTSALHPCQASSARPYLWNSIKPRPTHWRSRFVSPTRRLRNHACGKTRSRWRFGR